MQPHHPQAVDLAPGQAVGPLGEGPGLVGPHGQLGVPATVHAALVDIGAALHASEREEGGDRA